MLPEIIREPLGALITLATLPIVVYNFVTFPDTHSTICVTVLVCCEIFPEFLS